MAQPVYDQHPLQTYFTESERDVEIMPGGNFDDFDGLRPGKLPFASAVSWVLQALNLHPKSQSKAFAERFKYNVISSSLLSTSLQSTQRRTFHSRLPGRLSLTSETSSVYPTGPPPLSPTLLDSFTDSHWPLTLICMAVVALIADNFVLAVLIATSTVILFHLSKVEKNVKPQTMSFSLETLDELVKTGNAWHSAVHDAVTILESEEHSSFYGPTSTSSPSTSLRMALQSSLHTTQIQSDNIRQLFSALTSPADLAPLSEMYAPASPVKSTFDSDSDVAGPSTLRKRSQSIASHTRARTMSVPDVPSEIDKRATWNGSHSNLARSNTSPMHMFRRKFNGKNRRSKVPPPLMKQTPSFSAPVTPSLNGVKEEIAEGLEVFGQEIELPRDYTMASGVDRGEILPVTASDGERFGQAALDMRRKRMSGGLEAFRRMGYDSVGSPRPSPRHQTSSLSPSSRFTLFQTSRHPLSISALNLALQGALSAKRYTCSHLLALRFEEEEEYWEDVRSVMTLLTTSLADATERLMEALDEAEERRIKDETPSLPSLSREASASPSNPATSPPQKIIALQSRSRSPPVTQPSHSHSRSQTQSYLQPLYLPQSLTPIPRHLRSHSVSTSSSMPPGANDSEFPTTAKAKQPFRSIEQTMSYAPTPSHLIRFAAHVDALTCAVNQARDNLEQCVTALRDTTSGKTRDSSSPDVSLDDPFADPQPQGSTSITTNTTAAIDAYERVRKELGLAFRECERGRDHLLQHIQQMTAPPPQDAEGVLSGSDMEVVPALGHDNGTDESVEERGFTTVEALFQTSTLVANASLGFEDGDNGFSRHLESRLEDTHPKFIGVEEVFEADTEDLGGFKRERSKLTREERIALAKARRERKGLGLSSTDDDWTTNPSGTRDRRASGGMGPGVEVVQELKDVIWRVGEKRRKMAEQQLSMSRSSSSSEYSSPSGSISSPAAVFSPTTPSLTLQDIVAQRRMPSPFTRVDSS